MDHYDCVVIGAGCYGLAAAKQYHWLFPESSLAIFESEASLGGSFADHRLYPGLKSNNLIGTYEYPDFPMSFDKFGIKTGQHVPGDTINRYFKEYAAEFGIAGLIHFNTVVNTAAHLDTANGGWDLTVTETGKQQRKVHARKLIVATGLTSQPFVTQFKDQETFGGKIFHTKSFLQNSDTVRKGDTVTIYGGGKSAWDAVHTYATAGAKVNWVIRASGRGPCWMSPPFVTPLKKWIEHLANTRFLTWLSPCIWGDADGYGLIRRFFHGTLLGRILVNTFWKILASDNKSLNNYDSHPKTSKLKPWTEAMFTGPSFSIHNYDTDIFELIKSDLVDVHIGDISRLGPGRVHLTDGTVIDTRCLLVNTGWKQVPLIKFLPEGIENDLGLPRERREEAPDEDIGNQHTHIHEIDEEIQTRYPMLKSRSFWNKDYVSLSGNTIVERCGNELPENTLTPFMLYHFLVPPSERLLRARDIAFVGFVSNFSNVTNAHIQGLWVSAYFSRRLARDPAAHVGDEAAMAKLRHETMLHNRFGKWRYPTDWGSKSPCFIFDAVPYLDLLQRDLGLSPHRKSSFWAEMWDPYGPWDYGNINLEWLKNYEA